MLPRHPAPPPALVSAPSAVQGILAEVYATPWRAEEWERTPAKAVSIAGMVIPLFSGGVDETSGVTTAQASHVEMSS